MSPNIDALPAAAEHAEKRKCRGNRQPSAPPAQSATAPPRHTEATEHTDRAKNRRGGAYRDVGCTVQKSVGKIAARAGQQHESASEPRAHHARYGTEE